MACASPETNVPSQMRGPLLPLVAPAIAQSAFSSHSTLAENVQSAPDLSPGSSCAITSSSNRHPDLIHPTFILAASGIVGGTTCESGLHFPPAFPFQRGVTVMGTLELGDVLVPISRSPFFILQDSETQPSLCNGATSMQR